MTEEQEKAIERMQDFAYSKTSTATVSAKEMKTISNLIQQQQEESEKCKYLYHKALSELVIADKKNIEKDKIIDEMAEWIFDKDYNENSLFIDRDDYYSNCIKRVKQYFEKKVSEEKTKHS